MSSSSKSQSTTSNTINPMQMGQYQANYQHAQNAADSIGQPYNGQLVAGFTPTQVQAMTSLGNVATNPLYQNQIQSAANSVQGILGNLPNGTINPASVNAGSITPSTINASPYSAAQLSGTDLTPYLNPYTQNVINTTMGQFDQANKNELNNVAQSATAQGAFGGSRSGVAQALTNYNNTLAEAPVIAGLNQFNYSNAQNAALSDIAAKNAASQFNSSQNVAAQGQNVANSMSAQAQNIANALAAGEFNSNQDLTAQQNSFANRLAANQQGLTAADQLAALGNQGFQMATNQGGLLANVGQAQQEQQQAVLSAAYQNWLQGKQLTLDQQQLLNQALGIIPIEQTTNSTSKTSTNPGVGGVLGSIGSLALAAAMPGTAGMFGASSLLGGLLGGGAAAGPGGYGPNGMYIG